MGPHVHLQLLGAGKPLVTISANVRLVSRVSSHVDDKLTTLNECFVAKMALVWTLPCVDSHVSVQLP